MHFLLVAAISPGDSPVIFVHRLSLLDYLRQAGPVAMPCAVLSLLLIVGGVALMVIRPRLSIRLGFSVLATVPAIWGLSGSIIGAMKAFANLGMAAPGFSFISALGEVSTAFTLGLFGSAMAMTLAAVVWMMPVRRPPVPPPIPG